MSDYDERFQCANCGEAPTFEGCDDCVACVAAYYIHQDPDQLTSARRIYAGTSWLLELETEVARQLGRTLPAGHAVAA